MDGSQDVQKAAGKGEQWSRKCSGGREVREGARACKCGLGHVGGGWDTSVEPGTCGWELRRVKEGQATQKGAGKPDAWVGGGRDMSGQHRAWARGAEQLWVGWGGQAKRGCVWACTECISTTGTLRLCAAATILHILLSPVTLVTSLRWFAPVATTACSTVGRNMSMEMGSVMPFP